ncbi:uncharacterized protein [Solanum tuberosum]|uniref:uncharacterized protein n=1 Tax=Solanum tuberosum TaxID=4113 RepID=UPI00073A1300|nr:PREDICTED: uncharacterized protein LOC107063045 [Solanum tuberosum]
MVDTEQYIHGLVDINNTQFQFTVVYGLHTISTRIPLWTAIHKMSSQINEPWLIMGDFNSILEQEDRIVGSQVQDAETKDFKECVNDSNLVELQIGGRNFTWTNGHVYSRIDKAIVNAEWVNKMATQQVIAMEPLFSDHSPLGLIMEEKRGTRKRPFRFYNCIGKHPEFRDRVKDGWQILGGGMKGVWRNLKRVRKEMQHLNNKEFMGVSKKVQ